MEFSNTLTKEKVQSKNKNGTQKQRSFKQIPFSKMEKLGQSLSLKMENQSTYINTIVMDNKSVKEGCKVKSLFQLQCTIIMENQREILIC